MAIGQMKALKNVIRNNIGKVFSDKHLKTMVATELSVMCRQPIQTGKITLIFSDLTKGNHPLLRKNTNGYECLPLSATDTQQSTVISNAFTMPLKALDNSYFSWENPSFYKYDTLDKLSRRNQTPSGMLVFLTNTEIHNGVNLDDLAQYIIKFHNIDLVRLVYSQLDSFSEKSISKCSVKFVSPEEIKNLYFSTLIDKLKTILGELEQQFKKCEKLFVNTDNYNFEWSKKSTREICKKSKALNIETDINSITTDFSDLLPSIETLIKMQTVEQTKNDLQKLYETLVNIRETIKLSSSLMGLYSLCNHTIYLCLENIVDETRKNSSVTIKSLAESVLVHEYTHHVHMSLMSGEPKNENVIYKDAVLETVAETVQYLFAEEGGDPALIAWLKKHSESGVFPGWGYAGESILRNALVFQQNTKLAETELLDMLIGLSVNDWHSAYCLIQAINKNNFAYNKDYVVFFDEKNVWAISKIYVPYTIGKNSLASSRKSLKSDLQAALSKIGTNATGKLYAEFWGKVPKGADIENILFYNIKGESCFSGLATENLDFTGDENSHGLSNELYYYHYKIEDSIPDISDSLLCKWDNFKIDKINSTQTPYAYFSLIKENCSRIKVDDKAEAADNLVLELTVNYPKKKKLQDIVLVVKPMIDGIICGLHSPSDINPIIAKMIADKYSLNENDISKQLQNNSNTCLPPRNYVNAYRKNVKNSFKWNPADDLLKFVRIIVNEQEKAQLSISGRLFKK